jgi:hypothetical protein
MFIGKIAPYFGNTSTIFAVNILCTSWTTGSRLALSLRVSSGDTGDTVVLFSLTMFVLASGND